METLAGRKTCCIAKGISLSHGKNYSLYAIMSDHGLLGYAFCRSSFLPMKSGPEAWDFVFLPEQRPKQKK